MEIVKAELGDERELAEDFWYPLAKEMEKYSEINELKSEVKDQAKENFREQIEDDSYQNYFLRSESKKVGFMTLKIEVRESRKKERYLAVINLFVKEGYRNKGYGTKLLEKAEDIAAAENCGYMMIFAEFENEGARKLYENLGYKPKKVRYAKELD